MNLRTIKCWAVYNPKRRIIVNGFRTKKEMEAHYSAGIPIGCVLVKLKGHYPAPRISPREQSTKEKS